MPKIIATGMYLPEKLVTNDELYRRFGKEDLEKIFERIGHGARYHSAPDESAGDHAVKAALMSLERGGIKPEEIAMVIVATDTPSFLSPATASYVQYKIGAKNAATFDVNCACSAFVTSLDIAGKYISTDKQYKTALVVGTYAMSKFLDPNDSVTYPLFGDGAGAVILQRDDNQKHFLASKLIADGSYWDYMGIYGGGSAEPAGEEMLKAGKQCVRILKKYPPTLNSENWPPLIEQTLQKASLTVKDIDFFIFTQIRRFTIEEVMQKFSLPLNKTHWIMDKWGYTGSACIPMTLHDAIEQGKLKRGQKLVLCASGGGFAMACLAMIY
ncbi:MAG: ketoacyl-ACP synthase III [Elusimicrobia bacterium]|nr:ketoacyl-ACP synthase III [Elusimicrobiota bacterium]